MSKEYTWKLPVGENEKEITCEMDGNKYFIYVGDAFITTFYKTSTGDVDEPITLCGIPCRFVAFNENPDLLVEGNDILLGSGKSYSEQKASRKKANRIFALAEILIGLFALTSFIILAITKDAFTAYIPAYVIPLAFIILGAWELYNLNRKKAKKDKGKKDIDKS